MTRADPDRNRSVLLADGNRRLGRVLGQLLEDEPGLDLLGVCATREELLTATGRRRPDVVLVSETLGARTGADVCGELRQVVPGSVLLLWSHDPEGRVAADLGADALIDRGMTFRQLVRAVRHPRSIASTPTRRAVPRNDPRAARQSATASDLGLSCETCALQAAIPTADMAVAVELARAFFAAHDRCATSIDLAEGRAVRRTP